MLGTFAAAFVQSHQRLLTLIHRALQSYAGRLIPSVESPTPTTTGYRDRAAYGPLRTALYPLIGLHSLPLFPSVGPWMVYPSTLAL